MPTYTKDEFKESNINYLNKDFTSFKKTLIDYAKAYYPNTYRDFNETSPGMMLMEMSAYVGDVLSFYIDQQYREMILPLAEERRNIVNMAKMFGYKVKPIIPAYVDLTFQMSAEAVTGNEDTIDYTTVGAFDTGIRVTSVTNSDISFETLEPVDFTISQSNDTNDVETVSTTTGLIETYTLSRTVRAVSGETTSKTFTIKAPTKFLKLDLPEKNVIDIISIVDSNGNNWYEVDFLAQDKVPITTHYSHDLYRDNAYYNLNGEPYTQDVAVPYTLTYIKTNKRFVRETNEDNTTSLVFGNGILRNGTTIDEGFLDLEQLGIIIPGQSQDLNESIDPLLGDEYSTLGETPMHTTLTITYRTGGGINTNVTSGDLSNIITSTVRGIGGVGSIESVTNNTPAVGGRDEETTSEIREKTRAWFTTQNRAVTKEDYEARILNIPSKYGNIAKVYVTRNTLPTAEDVTESYAELFNATYNPLIHSWDENLTENEGAHANATEKLDEFRTNTQGDITDYMVPYVNTYTNISGINNGREDLISLIQQMNNQPDQEGLTQSYIKQQLQGVAANLEGGIQQMQDLSGQLQMDISMMTNNINDRVDAMGTHMNNVGLQISNNRELLEQFVNMGALPLETLDINFGSITVYILAYDKFKNLVGNPNAELMDDASDQIPLVLKHNLNNYLDNFRLLTDDVMFLEGYIINFGVFFEVVAHKHANKQQVKVNCINTIIDYFRVEKMQFSQPIFISQLEYELMGLDGVRSVNYITLTQEENYNGEGSELLPEKTFRYSINSDGTTNNNGTEGYGYAYDFKTATVNKTVLPPSPTNPGVFELKNPRTNIQGVVR